MSTCRLLIASVLALAALSVAMPVAIAQEVSPPAPGIPETDSLKPVIPYSVAQQLVAKGDDIDDLKKRHPWVPNNAPFPLGFTYVQGSWRNADGSTTIVYCLLDVAAEHPLWYQENVRRTWAVGGVRCNVRLNEAAGGAMTGTARGISYPSGSQLASAPLGTQHAVPEGQGSGWQAYGVAEFDRASTTSNQQVQLEARLVLPAWAGATSVGWNSLGRGCTRGSSTREVTCELWSPPFQTLPYPCPGGAGDGNFGAQPPGCVKAPPCPSGQYGTPPNCVTPPSIADLTEYGAGLTENPDAPVAEPAATDDTDAIDDEDAEDEALGQQVGEWVALDGETAQAVNAGSMTLTEGMAASAAAGRPPYRCKAYASIKVGGARYIHQEGPDIKQRTVRWRSNVKCVGGQNAIYWHGYSFLDRINYNVWSRYADGSSYNDTDAGAVMHVRTKGKTVELGRRKAKRIQHQHAMEVPPPYQWVNDEPFTDFKGINETKTTCKRYVASGYPSYLNGISCRIYSNRRR